MSFTIKHPDESQIEVKSGKNQIIKPNILLSVKGAGLPIFKNELSSGDLNVQFVIEFPDCLND